MNSTKQEKRQIQELPCLMKDINRGFILLVSEMRDEQLVGVVVFSNNAPVAVGDFGKHWNGSNFKEFHGIVTLNTA